MKNEYTIQVEYKDGHKSYHGIYKSRKEAEKYLEVNLPICRYTPVKSRTIVKLDR